MTVQPEDIPALGRLSTMTCLSGGADGADRLFGEQAEKIGHQVVHWSFSNHKTPVPLEDRVLLSEEMLKEADPFLIEAGRKLKRRVPFKKPGIINLLRRNYFQVRYTDQVIAVGNLDPLVAPIIQKDHFHSWADTTANQESKILGIAGSTGIQGGTAWACQMYIDMCMNSAINSGTRHFSLTFFDQISERYYRWDFNRGAWEIFPLSKSFPMVWHRSTRVYTGIGSRELTPWGKMSIYSAYAELKRLSR